ncbi:MAG: exodeoxyribonuclease VII large subunit [Burkholderiales bacterium]|nr:exodeoxyribonuclease VII large subunit [Burkholderiales bacterium]
MLIVSPIARDPPVLAVSELNRRIRELIETSVPLLWVGGEICNFTCATSGHWYFSLKDASAQVRCVMFRHKRQHLDWTPQEGMQVEARVLVTLYEQRGDYQLNVENLRRAGLGELYEKFERLKSILAAEGLFDPARKRPLPTFPRCIGVITSLAGAALRDVLTTLRRRSPGTPVIVYPTPVQGEGAALKIAEAIHLAGSRKECDVLILSRGGGGIEDLWPFNEQIVARAMVACPIPIVCGVGHETDFTIADFVADCRAATPTAAAELTSPSGAELHRRLQKLQSALQHCFVAGVESRMQGLDHFARRLTHPGEQLQRRIEHVRLLATRLCRSRQSQWEVWRSQVHYLGTRLNAARPNPAELMEQQRSYGRRLTLCMSRALEKSASRVAGLQAQLSHLNPEAVLQRGYSIVAREDGSIVRDASQLAIDDSVTMGFARGGAIGRITKKIDPSV